MSTIWLREVRFFEKRCTTYARRRRFQILGFIDDVPQELTRR